uniref:C2H2-type domain-containing protein n=1 Tax=Glossina brevipalpis TaxID=37001 RepID=A0A1A9WWN6_9MUSC
MNNNQMNNAVRKIHRLLSNGAVTVTGPNRPRILRQVIIGSEGGVSNGNVDANINNTTAAAATPINDNTQHPATTSVRRCYICDHSLGANQNQNHITEMQTSHTSTGFPWKIARLFDDSFSVIVSVDDVVCTRCTNLINYLDRLDNDIERVRMSLKNLLNKKYGIGDDENKSPPAPAISAAIPPNKIRKLNNGTDVSVSAQQIRNSAHSSASVPQHPANNQVIQKKTITKIYKCSLCEYRNSDMRLLNSHCETCKHQNFQCKSCKKIFLNFGALKQHMIREHNTPMENNCSVCHINFANEIALRRHMELNHSTNVLVTIPQTVPSPIDNTGIVSSNAMVINTPVYTCIHCQLKSTDKPSFDEHMYKHAIGIQVLPFKCKLCAQRFETRDAASAHARQHQGNLFKCGTCSMSFGKRELLIGHFETHQQDNRTQKRKHQKNINQQQRHFSSVKQQVKSTSSHNMFNRQKISLTSVDGSLCETVNTSMMTHSTGDITNSAAANNIRFFSCHICSLTFIQENYYKQHMESHRYDANIRNNSNLENSITAITKTFLVSETSRFETNAGEIAVQQQHASITTHDVSGAISDADIESIFEMMHSDKCESTATTATPASSVSGSKDQVVITSQADSGGAITFNVTLSGQETEIAPVAHDEHSLYTQQGISIASGPASASIDMPTLDQADETIHAAATTTSNVTTIAISKSEVEVKSSISGPVSMPSLDDDSEERNLSITKSTTFNVQSQAEIDNNVKPMGDGNIQTETEKQCSESSPEAPTSIASENFIVSQDNDINVAEEIAIEMLEAFHEQQSTAAVPEIDQQQQVPLELDAANFQAQMESGQIKFVLNENGELLQLDNQIITDADGNQILLQDSEQVQQLLQSSGVFQVMTDANGRMVLVQGDNNEAQLIDPSLLNADGQLVIQQSEDFVGSSHVIGEDGTRIPVSVSYTEDGQPIVKLQEQVHEPPVGNGESIEKHCYGAEENGENADSGQHITTASVNTNSNDSFFAFEEIIHSFTKSASVSTSCAAITGKDGKEN